MGALVLANLAPVGGVVWLGWEVFPLILLFWLENVVVGGFNVLRMLCAQPREVALWVVKVVMIPFFIFHYGMFTAVHGIFVFAIFGRDVMSASGPFPNLSAVWGAMLENHVAYAAALLVVSHGFSFGWNYLRGGEYRDVTIDTLMSQPYRRVVVLHLTIIFGGMFVMALGAPTVALLLLVGLKIGIDVTAHLRERRRLVPAVGGIRRAGSYT